MKHNKKAFSIIEVMIAIFVFAFGLTSVFAMLSGSISMSDYSRNLIVASNLADEQLEMFKNIRDSNYNKGQKWDITNPAEQDFSATDSFTLDTYYKLEYNTSGNSNSFPVLVTDLGIVQAGILNDSYALCITPEGQYTYNCGIDEVPKYYRYIHVEKTEYSGGDIDNAYKVTSKVIWVGKKTHSTEISTVVTDWKRY